MTENKKHEIAFAAVVKWLELGKPGAFTFRRRYAIVRQVKDYGIALQVWDHDGTWLTNIAAR